jgi:hypothetical protein
MAVARAARESFTRRGRRGGYDPGTAVGERVMRSWIGAFAVATLSATPVLAPRADEAASTVVVELFTSQGCNACPPADEMLAELAQRPGVIALALHVDYWNYLGWRDTFSMPENTARQREYARMFGERMIYTPQLVVNGKVGMVGSRRDAIEKALAEMEPMPVAVTIAPMGDMLTAEARSVGPVDAEVLYVVHDAPATVRPNAGENDGRELQTVNPVRLMTTLERWSGGEGSWTLPAPSGAQGVVVMVQATKDRRILGAARYDRTRR